MSGRDIQEALAERQLAFDLEAYVGLWVAVHNHRVIAYELTLTEVIDAVGDAACDGVFQVAHGGPCSFAAEKAG